MKTYIECQKCGSRINVDTGYDYIPCACGAIAVDGGPDYCRIIGHKENYKLVSDEDQNWQELSEVLKKESCV